MPSYREWFGSQTKLSHSALDVTPTNGLDTKSARTAVGANFASWLLGFHPEGDHKISTIPGPTAEAYVVSDGDITSFYHFTINQSKYVAIVTTTGVIYIFDAISGTSISSIKHDWIVTPALLSWMASRLLVLTSVGLLCWNGKTWSLPSSVAPEFTVTNVGGGYSTQPTMTVSSGTATAKPLMAIRAVTINAGGTGYVVGDVVSVTTGTTAVGLAQAQLLVTTVSVGVVTNAIVLKNTEYSTLPTSPVVTSGGSGTGLKFAFTYDVVDIELETSGIGYDPSTPPTWTFSTGTAAATCVVMPTGLFGKDMEVFQERLCVISGRALIWSAPDSYVDFSTGNTGGLAISTDPLMHEEYNAIVASVGYLYLLAEGSVYIISGFYPNQAGTAYVPDLRAISHSNGTSYRDSVIATDNIIRYANEDGIYAIEGAQVAKVSTQLDGFYKTIVRSAGAMVLPPMACEFELNGVLCVGFLFKYNDGQEDSSILMITDGQKWFADSQASDMTCVGSCHIINPVKTAHYASGNDLYMMFQDYDTQRDRIIKSGLSSEAWFLFRRNMDAIGLVLGEYTNQHDTDYIDIYVDTEYHSDREGIPDAKAALQFITDEGLILRWLGDVTFDFSTPKTVLWKKIEQTGYFLGATLKTNIANGVITHLGFQSSPSSVMVS